MLAALVRLVRRIRLTMMPPEMVIVRSDEAEDGRSRTSVNNEVDGARCRW